MNDTQFTPGPWYVLDQRASTQREQGFSIPGHDVILISSYAPDEINREHCDCIIARIDFSNRPEELGESNFATARLIAAAPDYDAASEMLLKWFDSSGSSISARWDRIPPDFRAAIVNAFRAARAKARGEQVSA